MGAYLIAELGQNHQGELSIAKEIVNQLVGTGVSAIKTAKREIELYDWDYPYDSPHSFGKTYYEHRKQLELSKDEFKELADYSRSKGFDFISSFTDIPSFDFLYSEIKPEFYKIASSRVADLKLLNHVAKHKVNTILSTGMSNEEDVRQAAIILNPKVIMQCTSCYPTDYKDLNLRVIKRMNGFSGHHLGNVPDVLAYSLGANYIERHVTLNRDWKGTDHKLSILPNEFKLLHEALTEAEIILGSDKKEVLECEQKAINKLRNDLLH